MNNKKLSKKEVLHIADLANLELTEKEVELFRKQLSDVLQYIEVLNELDTEEVEPTSQVTGLENVTREDISKKDLTQEEALSQAKSKLNGYFKVKAIFE
jgi:aspartyl-tRNA(Asn)/glutamyl-tRNA(Gln) amidotransferase subunit C